MLKKKVTQQNKFVKGQLKLGLADEICLQSQFQGWEKKLKIQQKIRKVYKQREEYKSERNGEPKLVDI